MTEKDLEIQRLRAENARLRHRLHMAITDLNIAMVDSPCRVCANEDAECKPHGGNCVPVWRAL